MFESIGFGSVLITAFLFGNVIWAWNMVLTPAPGTMRRKQAPRRSKSNLKKVTMHSPLPLAQVRRRRAGGPIAQPIP